jgi:hypothetical protein
MAVPPAAALARPMLITGVANFPSRVGASSARSALSDALSRNASLLDRRGARRRGGAAITPTNRPRGTDAAPRRETMHDEPDPVGSPRVLDVEQVDLAELRDVLCPHEAELSGSDFGRSRMRDIVVGHLGCSMLEAENLVETLIARGFAQLQRDPEGREGWRLSTAP